eukprot:gene305-550_t
MPPRRRGARSEDSASIDRRNWYATMQEEWKKKEYESDFLADNDLTGNLIISDVKGTDTFPDNLSSAGVVGSTSKQSPPFVKPFKIRNFDSFALSVGGESFDRVEKRKGKPLKSEEEIIFSLMEDLQPYKWLVKLTNPDIVRGRLICFHGIGGTVMTFAPWRHFMASLGIELCCVNLPEGRYTRRRERHLKYGLEIVANLAEVMVLANYTGPAQPPTVVFGHHVGALLAYELALELRVKGLLEVTHLVVSDCVSPKLVAEINDDWKIAKRHKLDPGQFVAEMVSASMVPTSLLQRRDMLELFVQNFRTDYQVWESYRFPEDRRKKAMSPLQLRCMLTTIRRSHMDSLRREDVAEWEEVSVIGSVVQRLSLDPEGGALFACGKFSGANENRVLRAVAWACLGEGAVSGPLSGSLTDLLPNGGGGVLVRQDEDLFEEDFPPNDLSDSVFSDV